MERHGFCGVTGCRSEVHEYAGGGLQHVDGPKNHEPMLSDASQPAPVRGWWSLPMAAWAWEGDAREWER